MKAKSVVCLAVSASLLFGSIPTISLAENTAVVEANELTMEQSNAIAMLNYITVLSCEINASKNSRLYLENAYSSLINNTYPNAVDNRTLTQLTNLLDTMENYRMIDVKREHLQYIYEQNQAQAIYSAIPNPLGLLSATRSYRPGKIAASIFYMAVDSVASYASASNAAELQYIQDGWELDAEEAAQLHESRKGTFSYMVKIVGEYNLPGDLTLTENAVDEFVSWKNNDNVVGRIRFLESNKQTYQSYGGYWLLLAESYYENGNFAACIDAIKTYDGLGTRIFRKDYEYAKVLPLIISAADEIYDDATYVSFAVPYAQAILDNTDHDDWALRYFAAQTYIDAYGRNHDAAYLQKAYEVTLDSVNYLVAEQRELNKTYLAPVVEQKASQGASNSEKDQINNYNKMLK